MNLKSGTNILYWRTGGVLVGSKVLKPVFLRNIQIEGQELCFPLFKNDTFFTALPPLRCRLHIGVFSLQSRNIQQLPGLVGVRSLPS